MQKSIIIIFIIVTACFGGSFGLLGCSHFGEVEKLGSTGERSDATKNRSHGDFGQISRGEVVSEQDLKIAKLVTRIDEIEELHSRLKEKVRVLEKGFLLGLIPEELEKKYESIEDESRLADKKGKEKIGDLSDQKTKSENLEDKSDNSNHKEILDEDKIPEDYTSAIAGGHEQFRAGNYGRAVVEFTEVEKKFGDKIDGGSAKFWIAKSWIALKELNTAKAILAEFLDKNTKSSWLPRAKLELARIEWRLGLRDTAIKRLREIIDSHPYEDAAEMAKMEIDQLDQSL